MKVLECIPLMQSAFGGDIGAVCLFGRVKRPKPDTLPIDLNLSKPLFAAAFSCATEGYAHEPMFIGSSGDVPVLRVYGMADASEVGDTVIASNAINVIRQPYRPFTVHVEPSELMRSVDATINLNADIPSGLASRPASASGGVSPPAPSGTNPRKMACFRIVMHDLTQALRCNLIHTASVAVSACKVLAGQVRKPDFRPLKLGQLTESSQMGAY